jgi:hypothetical protein
MCGAQEVGSTSSSDVVCSKKRQKQDTRMSRVDEPHKTARPLKISKIRSRDLFRRDNETGLSYMLGLAGLYPCLIVR